jgi:hypothetical protein
LFVKTARDETIFENISSPKQVSNDVNKIISSIIEKEEEKGDEIENSENEKK